MLATLLTLAAEAAEPSKTAYYIIGIALAAWAVVLAFIGLRSPEFPRGPGAARGVMTLSVLLALGAMTAAVVTA